MRIGIDCRMWNETGIGRYIRNIVRVISELDHTNEYILFVLPKDRDSFNLPDNFTFVATDIRWHSFKEQFVLPIYFYRANLNILFVPNLNVPILYLKKFVVTIHDLTVTKVKTGRASTLPYFFYMFKRVSAKIVLWYAIVKSDRIFTVTESVKNEILEAYPVKPSKIFITPCAAEKHFFRQINEHTAEILSKYSIKKPYIFYIGNAHPHKNLERLIEAFELVGDTLPDLTLVLGGSKKFFYERIEKEWRTKKIFSKLNFTGFVNDSDLPYIYSSAEAFVNPSLYEGFGIQLLEAFSCETKVVCSNTSSLPEIGGNIAYYFNPRDKRSIAEAIVSCLKDTDSTRVAAGLVRAKQFTWEKSGKLVHEVLVKRYYENSHSF